MTHQNHQTNGASLEDCHTNFFALTELYGIKWRKLVWGETSGDGSDSEEDTAPLADPVISSYARCLAGDILCVWRRVPQPQTTDLYEIPAPAPPPPLSLSAAKELWIFWYGEEPDLNGLVAPELISSQGDQGSWDSGLSYECRSLLFKALHNLIERCLLSRDFVRLGKWFVQPYDGDEEDVGKSPWHLSFSFAFFLHGESTVCASVDVRQHPPVRTLTAKRLANINTPHHQQDAKVILAPFGLEGRVTGRSWGDGDPATARLLDSWRQLYPLEHTATAVEVVCNGVVMRYPLPYVLVTEMEAAGCVPHCAPHIARAHHALTTPKPHKPLEACFSSTLGPEKTEDFNDPTRKTPCTCAKWRRRRAPRPRPAPFHARARPPACHRHGGGPAALSPGSCGGASPAAAVSAPPSAGAPPPSPHLASASQCSGTVPLSLHTPAPTPDPLAPATPAPASHNTKLFHQSSPAGVKSECGGGGGGDGGGGGGGDGGGGPSPPRSAAPPALPAPPPPLDPHAKDHALHMLYDYSTVTAWLEHPVKRFKTEEKCLSEALALGAGGHEDLYAGHQHTSMAAPPLCARLSLRPDAAEEDVKEYKNLFTSDGLCPTIKDLDQIFENSDDAASGDETMGVEWRGCGGGEERWGGRAVRAEELSKMFPTPPSLEAHAQASPGFTLLGDCSPHLATDESPKPDPIEDWSYVFKPPTVYKYVGSSKYAPLATLPSQLLPPVAVPSSAVYRPRWQHQPPPKHHHTEPEPPIAGVKRSLSPPPPGPAPPWAAAASPLGPRPLQRACPLLLNVLLADTVLNLFRDHNFDSCTLCVCNAGTKYVGNIRGADASTYLFLTNVEDSDGDSPSVDEEPSRCTCGFSAVLNRRLAHRAGLFYEDEMEITGVAAVGSRGARGGSRGGALEEVVGALLAGAAGGGGVAGAARAEALARAARGHADRAMRDHLTLNLLEYSDGGSAARLALRAAAGAESGAGAAAGAADGAAAGAGAPGSVHRWGFIEARAPRSSRDVVRLMRRLRPLLQDAIQKRGCGARMWDGVTGPLTWRQFHRLAGRGNEDLCEPQPVPSLLVGHDKDWLSLSPTALRHWERLCLEPYSYSRDVAYLVLAADVQPLAEPVNTFFRELSTTYESCRLGRHHPITRIAKDGIVRTSPNDNVNCEEWTGTLPPGRLGDYLKAYAETLRNTIVSQLDGLSIDRTLFESDKVSSRPASPGGILGSEEELIPQTAVPPPLEEEAGPVALVLYLVEPPSSLQDPTALHALLKLATRTYQRLQHLNPLIKIISLEGVCETWRGGWAGAETGGAASELRALAFSVFTSARRLLQHGPGGKTLTGFGTAAHENLFLSNKDEKNRAPYALFSPAWVLGAPRPLKEVTETWGSSRAEAGAVLFVCYCLSHDQRWLLAAATDARGELLDTAAINIHVPPRSRRKRSTPARRMGLTKLMDFMLGVMSQAAHPWRLVVGRVGRIGHGELKGWSWLLSRKNLLRASNSLKELCGSCVALGSAAPAILSACLVSTEPDPCLRLMADRFTPDERFSQASIHSHLHTPRDVTATHILVFPTSATTQSTQNTFEPQMANGEDNDMNDMFLGVDMADEEMGEDNMTDLLIGDMFTNMWAQGSPRREHGSREGSRDGSPARGVAPASARPGADAMAELVGTVLQQPLALGYLVSTAPLGGMPGWWWAGCAHLRDACPAFLKTALLLHAGSLQASDDYTTLTLAARPSHNAHPLDSQLTTDVLRYVLEGYNALSWLALDGTTHDRLSCLPFHVQVLMQLYHTAAALG